MPLDLREIANGFLFPFLLDVSYPSTFSAFIGTEASFVELGSAMIGSFAAFKISTYLSSRGAVEQLDVHELLHPCDENFNRTSIYGSSSVSTRKYQD